MSNFTLDDLRRILRECAGEDEPGALDGPIGDIAFVDLGYDSVAMLETASRVEREFDAVIPDALLVELRTPDEFVCAVVAHQSVAA